MNKIKLNSRELESFLLHIINTNKELQIDGKVPIAVNVEGVAGIGKTSLIHQIAEKQNLQCVKVNLAQLEELGDLIGYPHKELEVEKIKDNKSVKRWVTESTMPSYVNAQMGYKPTGQKKMTYAIPEWVQTMGEAGILILDDYTRADPRFTQAMMELIVRQEYMSWKLPKNWTIVMTTNPDNGDYLVTSLDDAQKTRFISLDLQFNIDCWAEWAENDNIDGRCINFLLKHPEVINEATNARSITTFFNCISKIKEFEDELPLIQMIGEGSVGTELTTLFTTFIQNKLDKMITPEEIMKGKDHKKVFEKIQELLGTEENYRADIASIITTRLINYNLKYAEGNSIDKDRIDRLVGLVTEDGLFTNDLQYVIIKRLTGGNKQKFQKMLMEPKVVKMAIK